MTASPNRISRAVRDPATALSVVLALLKGHYYKLWFRLSGRNFRAGKNLRVFGSLDVRGPGAVRFGDDVVIGMRVTPYTHDADARIEIGNHCFVNGTRFGCRALISVGDDCILAEARVMDTNFHSTRSDRWNPDAPVTTKPVRIERNVWIAANVGILPGSHIGANSVVGFGAVCSGTIPQNVIVSGNPAVVVRPVESP